ncbi:MAG: hypothetical protein QOK15_3 [Nocardioidaceae bacterium]|nr:hypothetical protein [Nocardioidaceae bacterium]
MTRHLLIIGAQRCGTTYLASLLDAHPEVTMARPARPEPKVFLSAEKSGRGLGWYDATFFAHATTEKVLGEKSTSYLEDADAPARAASVLGEPEILVMLRDPVQRAVSNWRFSTDHGLEERPLPEALEADLSGEQPWSHTGASVSPYAYLQRGRYSRYLAPWLAAFPRTLSVLFLEELRADTDRIGEVYAALGVDGSFRPEGADRPVNESEEQAPELAPAFRRLLDEYFAEDAVQLGRQLRRDPPWAARLQPTDTRHSPVTPNRDTDR